MADLACSPALDALLRGIVEEHAGLRYEAGGADALVERVRVRAVERGFESLLDYYYFLRYDEGGTAELELLAESLVVHETYFFRELKPLVALVDHFLAPAIASGRRVRIWHAAASTGEEPLTMAMLLAERGLLDRADLLATDLSARALTRAQRGEFGHRSLRAVVPGYERWLRVEGDRAIVAPELIAAIRWRRYNLVQPGPDPGRFDAIVCRNVLIYFSSETTAQVVERLSAHLAPDGVLLVGVSESLLSLGTLLRCEERGGVFFYDKRAT